MSLDHAPMIEEIINILDGKKMNFNLNATRDLFESCGEIDGEIVSEESFFNL